LYLSDIDKVMPFLITAISAILTWHSLCKFQINQNIFNKMTKIKQFFSTLGIAAIGGAISLGAYQFVTNDNEPSNTNPFADSKKVGYEIKNINIPTFDFAEVSALTTPTVVHIKVKAGVSESRGGRRARPSNPFDFFGEEFDIPRGPSEGSGSGVIISDKGYIVTNNHVVADADEIEVVLNDKRSFKADVVGKDPNTDLALIKIQADGLSPVKIGNSDGVRVGEWVLAVGNPFNLNSTVTAGIVSAKGRNINLLGGNTAIESFIQTDAAVNPGNSGGALINSKGELIGINTAIASQTGSFAGYSFAVPVNIMNKVVKDFMEFGEVQRGFIGVQIREVDAELAKEKGLKEPKGVYVDALTPNGAADKAGIEKGDVIKSVDGKEINSVSSLQEYVGSHRPGDEVKVMLQRDGKDKEIGVILRNKDGKITEDGFNYFKCSLKYLI
jgi:Do/DeqQ family serine protease